MRRALGALGALAVALACDHSAAGTFAPPPRGPLGSGNPHRVTFNEGSDLRPSWLADGSGFFYTRERLDKPDDDHCLGLLPGDGGPLVDEICARSPASADSLDAFESAAVAADGRLAYVRSATPLSPPSVAPFRHELRLAVLGAPEGTALRSIPYTAPSGRVHAEVEGLQWLSPSALIYLADSVTYFRQCGLCPVDTIRTGMEVATIDPASGAVSVVAATDNITSIAAVGADSFYYTPTSGGQVLRRSLGNVTTSVAHDFGPGTSVRDVTVRAGRLAAVTGPGLLWWVQLSSGTETPLAAPGLYLFKRPALSPDGRHLVAEGYPFFVDTIRVPGDGIASIDTITSRSGDLWVFDLP